MRNRCALSSVNRRLLTLAEAAAYCGVSTEAFARVCPVPPISMAPAGRENRRLLRYDVVAIDEWIDLLGGRIPEAPGETYRITKVF